MVHSGLIPASHTSPWFSRRARHPGSRVTLFCFPFSGGGASIYNGWPELFPADIEICPVHLPGREERIEEPAELSPEVIARVLAERIDQPFAIYGHSLGARFGFEVLRSLRGMDGPTPVRFYPAASSPPDVADAFAGCVALPDDLFIATLIQRLGAPEELRNENEMRQLVLPLLRYDMRWCHQYRYQPGPKLATTVVALAGETDTEATPERMSGWSQHCERFRMLTLPGGHFFLKTAREQLTAMLARDLLGALAESLLPAEKTTGGTP